MMMMMMMADLDVHAHIIVAGIQRRDNDLDVSDLCLEQGTRHGLAAVYVSPDEC
jgi:hypothetical protein